MWNIKLSALTIQIWHAYMWLLNPSLSLEYIIAAKRLFQLTPATIAPKGSLWDLRMSEQRTASAAVKKRGLDLTPYCITLAVREERSFSVWKNWVKGSLETWESKKIHFAVLEKSGLWYVLMHIMKITVKPFSFSQLLQEIQSLQEIAFWRQEKGQFFRTFLSKKRWKLINPFERRQLNFVALTRAKSIISHSNTGLWKFIKINFPSSLTIQPPTCGSTYFHLTLPIPQVLLSSHSIHPVDF